MENKITVGELLKEINKLISHWNGVKVNDNGDYHRDSFIKINTYLDTVYPELRQSTWVIQWQPDMDFSMTNLNEELFNVDWSFKKDLRGRFGKGQIIHNEYKPNFELEGININELTVDEYVRLCRIDVLKKKLVKQEESIDKINEQLINARNYRNDLTSQLKKLYSQSTKIKTN